MRPKLSIAMIVRDEAEMAPGFLESVRGLWDELVVVDTGSVDATIEHFTAAGAHVVREPWRDDFAHARNVSLTHVTGDWVLMLDADERVSPEFIRELLAKTDDEAYGALTLRVSNLLPYGHRRESRVLRAWRHDQQIRFEHAIHEDASNSVARALIRARKTIGAIEAPVEHLGYVRERAAAKQKKSRDTALLRHCIAVDANDLYSRLKLLELSRYWRDSVLWQAEARATEAVLKTLADDALSATPWAGELIAFVAEGLFHADSVEGLAFLNAWQPRVPHSAALFHRRAVCHETRGQLDDAQRDFEKCLEFVELTGDQQLCTVRPRLGLTRLELARGRPKEALAMATLAVELSPRDPEALMAVATLTRVLEGAAGLEAWAKGHAALVEQCPERDWALGEASLAARDFKTALAHLRRAAGVPPMGPAAVRLAQCQLALGQLEESEALARTLIATDPEAGLGLLLFDLIRGHDSTLDLELTAEVANTALRQWVDALLASRNRAWLLPVARNAMALRQVFPWLEAYLGKKAG